MSNDTSLTSAATDLSKSRGWLIAGGILSVFVGFSAIASPLVFSLVIAQFLGVMVYNHWPSDSAAILGLFFGINLLFNGSSLLALGLSARKPSAA